MKIIKSKYGVQKFQSNSLPLSDKIILNIYLKKIDTIRIIGVIILENNRLQNFDNVNVKTSYKISYAQSCC